MEVNPTSFGANDCFCVGATRLQKEMFRGMMPSAQCLGNTSRSMGIHDTVFTIGHKCP